MGAKAFHHLPTKIKSMSNDLKNFKLQLTTFLMQNSFYMNNEFLELSMPRIGIICEQMCVVWIYI
jgi:hypothetical protein